MSSIFRPLVRRAINQAATNSSLGIFGGAPKVLEALKEAKETNMLRCQILIKTKKTGKGANKAGKNKGKKPAAGGSKAKARPKALERRAVAVKPEP